MVSIYVYEEDVVVCSGLTSLSTIFSHITTVSGCDRELSAHIYSAASLKVASTIVFAIDNNVNISSPCSKSVHTKFIKPLSF